MALSQEATSAHQQFVSRALGEAASSPRAKRAWPPAAKLRLMEQEVGSKVLMAQGCRHR